MSRVIIFILLALSLGANLYFLLRLSEVQRGVIATESATLPFNSSPFVNGVSYPFVRVVDGDTVTVGVNGGVEYVRLIGIDAPEPNDPGGPECFAAESTARLTELLQTGTVYLYGDPLQDARDFYNRLLAYVALPDGTDVGLRMLQAGYAREYASTKEYTRRESYLAAEEEAAAAQYGLWNPTLCR